MKSKGCLVEMFFVISNKQQTFAIINRMQIKANMKATEGQKLVSSDIQYQIASPHRQSYDNMLWQTPIVSLTGLAFLFLIALNHDTSLFARFLASVLALMTSSVSAQLWASIRTENVRSWAFLCP
jgi:hypothetical protein